MLLAGVRWVYLDAQAHAADGNPVAFVTGGFGIETRRMGTRLPGSHGTTAKKLRTLAVTPG